MGALTIRQVRKSYGPTDILKGIDLSIEPGEFLIRNGGLHAWDDGVA